MKIDYNLKIIGEKTEYTPRPEFINPIINSKSKIFEITGDNGYGKTFLLKLISYAFMADKLPENILLESLRKTIKRYDEIDKYNLTYSLEFNLKNNSKLKLYKENDGGRIIKIDDSPPNHYKNIHSDFSILYDVPLNPNERLEAVINDLKNWNEKIYKKLDRYIGFLSNEINDFENIRNEELVTKLNTKIKEIEERIEETEKSNLELTKTKTYFDSYKLINDLIENYRTIDAKNNQLKKKEEELKVIKKPTKILKKDESKITNLKNNLQILKEEFRNHIRTFLIEVNKFENLKKIIEEDNISNNTYTTIRTTEFENFIYPEEDDFQKIYGRIDALCGTILNFIENEENGKQNKINGVLNEILKQIDEIISIGAEGILKEITTLDSNYLKNEITKRLEKYSIVDYKTIKQILKSDFSRKIKIFVEKGQVINRDIEKEKKKKDINEDEDKYYELKNEKEKLTDQIKNLNTKTTELKYKINQLVPKFDAENLSEYDKVINIKGIVKVMINNPLVTDNIDQAIKDINILIQTSFNKISEEKNTLGMQKARLEIELNKKNGTYTEDEKETIRNVNQKLRDIRQKVFSYQKVIDEIIHSNFNSDIKKNQEFIKVAGKVIAFSLDYKVLRANGEYIKLNYYDLIERDYHCENDIIINTSEISTGLASGNYLKQRIQNIEGKYAVILLDEIGNMDRNTLNEVIKSIKKLENENRLLIAILTRPSTGKLEVFEH